MKTSSRDTGATALVHLVATLEREFRATRFVQQGIHRKKGCKVVITCGSKVVPESRFASCAKTWEQPKSQRRLQLCVYTTLHSNRHSPLQLGVAPNFATTLVVKYARRCPEGRWSCFVTIGAFRLSAAPFQGSPRTFLNLRATNLPSGGTRCADLAFLTPLSVMMMCSSVMGALPTQIPWPHFWSRLPASTAVYLYSTLSPKKLHLACVRLPRDACKCCSALALNLVSRQAPRRVTYQPSHQDAVAGHLLPQEIFE